jgi:hypothetical protein
MVLAAMAASASASAAFFNELSIGGSAGPFQFVTSGLSTEIVVRFING